MTFYIGIHMCHRRVYLLLLTFLYTVFRCLIYFVQYVCTSSRIFRVPVKFLIRSVRFWKFCNEEILWSTSEASIWFLTVTLITLIIRVALIKWWFLIGFFFCCSLKNFSVGSESPQWLHLDWETFALSLFLTGLSKFKLSICKSDIDNYFWSMNLSYILNSA